MARHILKEKDITHLLKAKPSTRSRRSRSVCCVSHPKNNAEAAQHMEAVSTQLQYLGLHGVELDSVLEYVRSKCPHTSELQPYCLQPGRNRGDARSLMKPPELKVRTVSGCVTGSHNAIVRCVTMLGVLSVYNRRRDGARSVQAANELQEGQQCREDL